MHREDFELKLRLKVIHNEVREVLVLFITVYPGHGIQFMRNNAKCACLSSQPCIGLLNGLTQITPRLLRNHEAISILVPAITESVAFIFSPANAESEPIVFSPANVESEPIVFSPAKAESKPIVFSPTSPANAESKPIVFSLTTPAQCRI